MCLCCASYFHCWLIEFSDNSGKISNNGQCTFPRIAINPVYVLWFISCSAVELGTDMLELDCHLTKDEQVVVSHDANLRRSSGIDAQISNMSYAVSFSSAISSPSINCHSLCLFISYRAVELVCDNLRNQVKKEGKY